MKRDGKVRHSPAHRPSAELYRSRQFDRLDIDGTRRTSAPAEEAAPVIVIGRFCLFPFQLG
jgi:hypothetical protein